MIRTARIVIVTALMAAILAGGWADFASAQKADTGPADVSKLPVVRCSDYVGLSNRIVMCLRDTIENATATYFDQFFGLVQGLVGGFLTLAVVIYGILAAYGMLEKPARDVMVLMVKLAFVTFFVVKSDLMYEMLTDGMDAASAAVVEFTPANGEATDSIDISRIECLKNMREAAARSLEGKSSDGPSYSAAWLGIDCTIDSVIGIRIPGNISDDAVSGFAKGLQDLAKNRKLSESNVGMSRGLLRFFFSSLQSSILGVLLGIVGFVFLYTLIWLVLKALFVYLAGYIGIAFMMIFAPLFIPLVLFRVTSEYFKKWVKLSIAFALQPVIILAFVVFAIAAIDLAMFSGNYSVMYRIAGDASRQSNFNLNTYLDQNQIIKRRPAVAAEVKASTETPPLQGAIEGVLPGVQSSRCAEILKSNPVTKTPQEESLRRVCEQTYPIQWWKDSIDWAKMAEKRVPAVVLPKAKAGEPAPTAEKQISREVFAALLFAAVVVLAINGLLRVIPSMVNDLIGESFQSPNLFNEVSRAGGGGGGIGRMFSGGRR